MTSRKSAGTSYTCFEKFKFLSPDQEEEHVSYPASLHVSVNLKKLKYERSCTAHALCGVHARMTVHAHACVTVHAHARGLQNSGKIVR